MELSRSEIIKWQFANQFLEGQDLPIYFKIAVIRRFALGKEYKITGVQETMQPIIDFLQEKYALFLIENPEYL
jgi:hypothetical protein